MRTACTHGCLAMQLGNACCWGGPSAASKGAESSVKLASSCCRKGLSLQPTASFSWLRPDSLLRMEGGVVRSRGEAATSAMLGSRMREPEGPTASRGSCCCCHIWLPSLFGGLACAGLLAKTDPTRPSQSAGGGLAAAAWKGLWQTGPVGGEDAPLLPAACVRTGGTSEPPRSECMPAAAAPSLLPLRLLLCALPSRTLRSPLPKSSSGCVCTCACEMSSMPLPTSPDLAQLRAPAPGSSERPSSNLVKLRPPPPLSLCPSVCPARFDSSPLLRPSPAQGEQGVNEVRNRS